MQEETEIMENSNKYNNVIIVNKRTNQTFNNVFEYKESYDKTKITITCKVKDGLRNYTYKRCECEIYYPMDIKRNGRTPDIYIKDKHWQVYPYSTVKNICAYGIRNTIAYVKLYQFDGKVFTYSASQVEIVYPSDNPVLNYFQDLSQEIAQSKSKSNTDVDNNVFNQLASIKNIDKKTALYEYVSGIAIADDTNSHALIFPFETNYSQIQAIRTAFSNRVSVIQGPPGTGKTKTITNIIANIIISGKTAAIVSNNGKAVKNIYDKLASYGISYLTLPLIEIDTNTLKQNEELLAILHERKAMSEQEPVILETVAEEELTQLQYQVNSLVTEIETVYQKKNELQQLKQQLTDYKTEFEHYKTFYENTSNEGQNIASVMEKAPHTVKPLLRLYLEFESCCTGSKLSIFLKKILIALKYRLNIYSVLHMNIYDVFSCIEKRFYEAKVQEIENAIAECNQWLANCNLKEKEKEVQFYSQQILNTCIAKMYPNPGKDIEVYDKKKILRDMASRCPIMMTTTFSIYNKSIKKDASFLFDYVIIDEASQVNLLTGALALACTKHAVIVGDEKQLPPILADSPELQKANMNLHKKYGLADGYNYFTHKSILSSVQATVANVKQTLLREHYRCHPKIIGFCNQKFYNNELIIMTDDCGEEEVLVIQKTAPGSHAKGHVNLRQIEESKKIRNKLIGRYSQNDILTITPYRDQNNKILKETGFESITVHKAQGQEEKVVIMQTVDNVVSDFVADPQLMNVAISRATERLYVIVSSDKRNLDTNIGDLIRYVQYNDWGTIREGTVHSIFDLLYKDYAEELNQLIARGRYPKKIDVASEKIFYSFLQEKILRQERFSHLRIVCHYQLRLLFGNSSLLSPDEKKYIQNPWTHVDFALFEKFGHAPILCIEVDGFDPHHNNLDQVRRDRMKDSIFNTHHLKLLRLSTNGNNELEIVENELLLQLSQQE